MIPHQSKIRLSPNKRNVQKRTARNQQYLKHQFETANNPELERTFDQLSGWDDSPVKNHHVDKSRSAAITKGGKLPQLVSTNDMSQINDFGMLEGRENFARMNLSFDNHKREEIRVTK